MKSIFMLFHNNFKSQLRKTILFLLENKCFSKTQQKLIFTEMLANRAQGFNTLAFKYVYKKVDVYIYAETNHSYFLSGFKWIQC